MRAEDFPQDTPYRSEITSNPGDTYADGGSCIAAPDGSWLVEPIVGEERLITATLDHQYVRQERQNLDPAGHYARPDVLQLRVNCQRQSILKLEE